MNEKLELYAIYLTEPLSSDEIETALNIKLNRGIRNHAITHEIAESMITYTGFDVLTFINWKKDDIPNVLNVLGIKDTDNILGNKYMPRLSYRDQYHS